MFVILKDGLRRCPCTGTGFALGKGISRSVIWYGLLKVSDMPVTRGEKNCHLVFYMFIV